MPRTYAEDQKRMELRNKALAANASELPHLEAKRTRLDELLIEVKSLTAEQASLASRKQDVSKRLAEVMQEGKTLVAFLDVGVKQHFGNRSEKLVEFGMQPFRGRPRLLLVGPDGKPLKPPAAEKEMAPTQPETA
jgi:hypothetical protein